VYWWHTRIHAVRRCNACTHFHCDVNVCFEFESVEHEPLIRNNIVTNFVCVCVCVTKTNKLVTIFCHEQVFIQMKNSYVTILMPRRRVLLTYQSKGFIYISLYGFYLHINLRVLFTYQSMGFIYISMYGFYLHINLWVLFTYQSMGFIYISIYISIYMHERK